MKGHDLDTLISPADAPQQGTSATRIVIYTGGSVINRRVGRDCHKRRCRRSGAQALSKVWTLPEHDDQHANEDDVSPARVSAARVQDVDACLSMILGGELRLLDSSRTSVE